MKTKFFSKWLWQLASLAVVLATLLGIMEPAYAIPPDPIDDEPAEVGDVPDHFTWRMVARFGHDADVDGITDYTYDPAFVNAATFTVKFKACPAPGTGQGNQYAWEIDGTLLSITSCSFSTELTPGRHHVKFTATPRIGRGHVYEDDILVRDILIVSLGDSIASGEGNPDIPVQFAGGLMSAPAQWVDRRCHRSAYAGPAQAALALERADPHTSVTFISLACSGAQLSHVGFFPYMGIEPAPQDTEPLPPQLEVLQQIVGPRHIDALIVSGGANDIVFGGIIEDCMQQSACHTLGSVLDSVQRKLQNVLPGHYAGLINKIALDSDELDVANVYFTEYPNLVRDADGTVCDSIMGEVLPPLSIDQAEATWAETSVFQPLNTTMHQAVDNAAASYPFIGWHYVDGIDEAFAGAGFGHGYCAGDQSWVRRVHDSACLQGPLGTGPVGQSTGCFLIPIWNLAATRGMMHPTQRGHQAYRDQLLTSMLPDLFPDGPPPEGPSFSADGSSGSTSNRLGDNGWVIGSCDGSACESDQAVLEVVAADEAEIHATSVAVDGKAGCDATSVSGVACTLLDLDSQRDGWQFTIAAEGIHRLEFAALNGDEQVSNFTYELKVDLTDPTATATVTNAAATVAGWYAAPVSVKLSGMDAAGLGQGSGVYLVEYNLDGAAGEVSPEGTVSVAGNGVHTLTYQSVDLAGRRSPTQSLTVQVDTTPPAVSCASPDGLWHATDVSLACTASDSVSGLANTADAAFTLATSLADGSETAEALTATRNVCDLAGNCVTAGPIGGNQVDKKAPTINITAPASTTYVLNQAVTASYDCADGGSGVASCAGPVSNTSPLDTTTLGAHTFVVDATDNVGYTANQSVSYTVAYNICALFDQTRAHRSGSTVPIKLQLCDAVGGNHSAASILVNASALTQQDGTASNNVEDSGNANPDDNFRYDEQLGGYIYNLSTDGLTTGTWVLSFSVSGDPIPHTVQFDVR